jgi:hypothetical protein
MSVSLFANLTVRDVAREPFAHLVSDPALPAQIYDRLAPAFPTLRRFINGVSAFENNQAIRIPAKDIFDNPEFAPEWRNFFRYHTSQEFWHDIVRVMGPALRECHPDLERKIGKPFPDWKVVCRGTGELGDVALDALFVINTPVKRLSSVRPAHVDSETEIWAGLLYMRPQDDKTEGGDLALYSFNSNPGFGGHYAPPSAVDEKKRIAYRANRLVSFVNSPASIHGVTPRPPTHHYRRYINLVATVPFEVFRLPTMPPFSQLRFWLERRKTKSHGLMAKSRY